MAETKGKKALSLCILRVLEQHAGKTNPLSTRHIIEYLKEDHGMIAERKAVGRNLILLMEMGFPLSTYQDNGKGYYLKTDAGSVPHEHNPAALDAYLRAPRSDRTEREIDRLQDPVPVFVSDAEKKQQPEQLFETLDLLKDAIAAWKEQISPFFTQLGLSESTTSINKFGRKRNMQNFSPMRRKKPTSMR